MEFFTNKIFHDNLNSLANPEYNFINNDSFISNLYKGSGTSGYSKFYINELSIDACSKYIVENKFIRSEKDLRTVELRFEFNDFFLISNRQSYLYTNNNYHKTLLILPKSRIKNYYNNSNVYETLTMIFHSFINTQFTKNNKILYEKTFDDFNCQKRYPIITFKYKNNLYKENIYPVFYKIKKNNKYNITHKNFINDINNMIFILEFMFYVNGTKINIEIEYKIDKIIKIMKISKPKDIDIECINFNHYYFNCKKNKKNYSLVNKIDLKSPLVSKELMKQIDNYYKMNIDFECYFILNKIKNNENRRNVRNIVFKKPSNKLFIYAVLVPHKNKSYPLLNSLVIEKILDFLV